jgi:hypothetical protein
MIPDIGVMIGFYIITKMVSFLTRSGARKESLFVRLFSVLTILITMAAMADLIMQGQK